MRQGRSSLWSWDITRTRRDGGKPRRRRRVVGAEMALADSVSGKLSFLGVRSKYGKFIAEIQEWKRRYLQALLVTKRRRWGQSGRNLARRKGERKRWTGMRRVGAAFWLTRLSQGPAMERARNLGTHAALFAVGRRLELLGFSLSSNLSWCYRAFFIFVRYRLCIFSTWTD